MIHRCIFSLFCLRSIIFAYFDACILFQCSAKIGVGKILFSCTILFYFKKGKKVSPTSRKICSVYKQNAVSDNTVRRWIKKYMSVNFILEDDLQPSGGQRITRTSNIQGTVFNEMLALRS